MIRLATLITLMAPVALAAPAAAQVSAPGALTPAQFEGRFDPTAVAALAKQAETSEQPTLKAKVTVAGAIVRIGDLVEHAGAAADIAIFRAPDLGQTGSVPAARVIDALRPHRVGNLDTHGLGEVVVTRASRIITAKDIEARILRVLAGRHPHAAADNLTLTLDNEVRALQVEPDLRADLVVSRLNHDRRTGRFDLTFELPGSVVARRLPLRFTGSLVETFAAAVLIRQVSQGEVLKASDLAIERRPKTGFTADTVTTVARALGLAARRGMRAGHALRQSDLMKPELVQRNETVIIVYEVPGILLTMRGKAQEAGAQGDLINVLNVQSKRSIQATVAGPGRVTVSTASARLAANAPSPRHGRAE